MELCKWAPSYTTSFSFSLARAFSFPSHSLEAPSISFFFLKVTHMFAFSYVGVFFIFIWKFLSLFSFFFTFVHALFFSKVYYLFLLFLLGFLKKKFHFLNFVLWFLLVLHHFFGSCFFKHV